MKWDPAILSLMRFIYVNINAQELFHRTAVKIRQHRMKRSAKNVIHWFGFRLWKNFSFRGYAGCFDGYGSAYNCRPGSSICQQQQQSRRAAAYNRDYYDAFNAWFAYSGASGDIPPSSRGFVSLHPGYVQAAYPQTSGGIAARRIYHER